MKTTNLFINYTFIIVRLVGNARAALSLLAFCCLWPMAMHAAINPYAIKEGARNGIYIRVLDVETANRDKRRGSFQEVITAEVDVDGARELWDELEHRRRDNLPLQLPCFVVP